MHSKTFVVATLAAVASAAPSPQLFGGRGGRDTENDLSGPCKPILFINARATGENGNFGGTSGPAICNALKQQFSGQVGCQGVGGAYEAQVMDNVSTRGTSAGAQREAQQIFQQAASKCPQTKIVASGFSQGSAVMNSAISGLSQDVQSRIVGVVLYGYTKNKQNGGKIQNFPGDRVLTFCEADDGVCGGRLSVTMGHFAYIRNGDFGRGAQFLAQKINQSGGSAGGAPAGAAAPAASPQSGGPFDNSGGSSAGGASGLLGRLGGSSSGGSGGLAERLRGRLGSS